MREAEGPTARTLREKLETAFAPTRLEITDDSERHRGHGGWREGGETHFTVLIRSPAFDGLTRVERSRAVHRALADELAGRVHALALDLGGSSRRSGSA